MLQIAKTTISSEGVTADILNQFWKDFKQMEKDQKQEYKLKVTLKSSDFPEKSVEEVKVENTKLQESKSAAPVGSSKVGESVAKENVIYINEEQEDSPENKKSLYKEALEDESNNEISQLRDKIKKLDKTYETMKTEIQQKEKELKELRDKESEEDAKAYKNMRVGGPGFRRQHGNTKAEAEFTILHLIAAIAGGLVIGMIISKIVF